MSVMLLDENETHSWPCYCGTCEPLPVHDFSVEEYRRKQIWQLMMIVTGQREVAMLKDNGWNQVFCVETDGHMETDNCSLEAFAGKLVDLGWAVENLERNQVTCPKCSDPQVELSEEEEREDFKVYEARGK